MGRQKEIDTSMYFCPREDGANYGKVGPDNQIISGGTYGKDHRQLLKCKVCGRRLSARRGTPLFGLKADEAIFCDVIACLVGVTAFGPRLGSRKSTKTRSRLGWTKHPNTSKRSLVT
jgi:hypothetical protein